MMLIPIGFESKNLVAGTLNTAMLASTLHSHLIEQLRGRILSVRCRQIPVTYLTQQHGWLRSTWLHPPAAIVDVVLRPGRSEVSRIVPVGHVLTGQSRSSLLIKFIELDVTSSVIEE